MAGDNCDLPGVLRPPQDITKRTAPSRLATPGGQDQGAQLPQIVVRHVPSARGAFETLTISANQKTQSEAILPGAPNRNYLMIQNLSTSDIFVSFGTRAANGRGARIPRQGFYEPNVIPTNEIYIWGPIGALFTVIFGEDD